MRSYNETPLQRAQAAARVSRSSKPESVVAYKAWNDLKNYLLAHEDDIAHGINDFGDLKVVFASTFQRGARKIDIKTGEFINSKEDV